MDGRWKPVSRDSKKDVKVILHPTAAIWEVRRGMDPGSDDSVDLSEFVSQGTQSVFEASVTLKFNRELFGDAQPAPNQILEIQLWQSGIWKPIWLGIIDAISSFTLQRGERSMVITAKTREQQDVWKSVKRLTPMFPQMTDFGYIAHRVARSAGMQGDEIILPQSAFSTKHSNTQMADMSAWEMLQQVCVPLGWSPFIDGLGRLRVASRELQHRTPDIILEDDRLIKVGGQRQRPPMSRVRVQWLNPTMKKYKKMDQQLGQSQTVTMGWFLPYWKRTFWFSDDKTLRAENARINWSKDHSQSANLFPQTPFGAFVSENFQQIAENKGRLLLINKAFAVALPLAINLIRATATRTDKVMGTINVTQPTLISDPLGGPVFGTIPVDGTMLHTVPTPVTGSVFESIQLAAWVYIMMTIQNGVYEIWGTPYDWVHARNTSEAFDSSVPTYVDNVMDIENDFIVDESHAKAVAIRELIYSARSANRWSVTLVDDPRIEYGDILKFTDGSQLFVEDVSRQLERGSEAILDVQGFIIPLTKTSSTGVIDLPSPVSP